MLKEACFKYNARGTNENTAFADFMKMAAC